MRKLTLALIALACLSDGARAQQAPTFNVGNFPAIQPASQSGAWTFGLSGPIPAGSNTIGAVTQSGTWAVNATLQPGSAIVGKVGIDQTAQGTTNGVVVNSSALPTGAATAANQSTANGSLATIATNTTGAATAANQASEITALQALNSRASYGNDFVGSLAGGASLVGQSYTAGSALSGSPARGQSAFTKFSSFFFSTQAGTGYIEGSNDGTNWTVQLTVALAATTGTLQSVSVVYPFYRARVVNGSTAATGTLMQSALLAN